MNLLEYKTCDRMYTWEDARLIAFTEGWRLPTYEEIETALDDHLIGVWVWIDEPYTIALRFTNGSAKNPLTHHGMECCVLVRENPLLQFAA